MEQSRYAIAQQLLDVPRREISEIAAMLEYADASAFGRTFKRWSGGVPPSTWRVRRKAAPPGSIDRR